MNNNFKKSIIGIVITGVFGLSSSAVFAASGLVEVYQLAANHDAKLAQARANLAANLESQDIAQAPLLPQVSADASYNKTDSNLGSGNVNTRTLGVSLSQSLYQHDSWARYSQSKFVVKEAIYAFKKAEQDIIVRVADTYFKVLLAQEDVQLAKSKEEANKTQWERANASAEVGLASKTDVLQAKSSFDLSRSDRISAENNLDVAYEELMKLTGVPIKSLKVMALNVQLPHPNLNMNEYEEKAQQSNLAVLQAVQKANAAGEEIEVQKSGHWFKLDLKAGYSDKAYSEYASGSAISQFSYRDRSDLNIGVYASIPLYSGGGTSARVSQARAQFKSTNMLVRDTRETARLNARIQVRNVERGLELVSANRAAVQSNDAFLEAAEESYKVGLKDLLDVLTARSNKFQARRNLASSLHNVVLSRLKLEEAVGVLTPDKLNTFEAILSEPSVRSAAQLETVK